MDPTKTLRIIQDRCASLRKATNRFDESEVEELVEAIEVLDKWLSRSGFLPKQWQYCHPARNYN